jgi:RNA-directed DNA polymerase
MKIYRNIFPSIISPENLFAAWETFKRDKRNKPDVEVFEQHIERHIFALHRDLIAKTYRHGPYEGFWIHDPKLRRIHKATVRDRILHHAIYKILNPIFEETFIPTSFSCRIGKGTHKGMKELAAMIRATSRNETRRCYALKCDVRKFFDSVDHDILLGILSRRIRDEDAMWLLREVVESFVASRPNLFERRGLPIGNLTSQIFANIYMNEFDQFMKHGLRVRYYVRYTDDFVIVSSERTYLEDLLPKMRSFLSAEMHLDLHPQKVFLRKHGEGVDFLGYIILLHHIVLRTKTEHRMFRRLKERVAAYRSDAISEATLYRSLRSYLGVLSHANAYRLGQDVQNNFWFWMKE